MADKKISQLTNLTGADLADVDEFAVVDASATETKAITFGELKSALDTSTGFVRITGDTMTGDLTVPNLITSGNVDGRDVSVDGTKLDGIEAGADVTDTANVTAAGALMDSELTNIAAVKALNQGVATTDSPDFAALNVNGTVTADGLTVDGDATLQTSDGAILNLKSTDTAVATNDVYGSVDFISSDASSLASGRRARIAAKAADDSGGSYLTFETSEAFNLGDDRERLRINKNGDISFYEDTGTTPKFFWDASAEALGIGTSSPAATLEVRNASAPATLKMVQSGAGDSTITTQSGLTSFSAPNASLAFGTGTGGAERVRIDSSGNVGIGTSSPQSELHVSSSANADLRLSNDTVGNGNTDGLTITMATNGNASINNRENASLLLYTNNTERARIDASGNLLVGTTNTAPAGNNVEGVAIGAGGYIQASYDSFAPMSLNRKTNDGDIAVFRKDGSVVGSIAADGGFMSIGTGDVGLAFNSSVNTIHPNNQGTLAGSDGQIDLGYTNVRFKDLYLSGTAIVGDGSGSSIGTVRILGGATSGFSNLQFADANDLNVGMIQYSHGSNYMQFTTNDSERARIDASGNLFVGKTAISFATVGIENRADGRITSTRSGDTNLVLHRLSTDGSLIDFYKDSTVLGSIKSRAGVVSTLILDPRTTVGTGVGITGSSQNAILPTDAGGNLENGAIDLGDGSTRFRNLYLSGSISDGTNSATVADIVSGGGGAAAWVSFKGDGTVSIYGSDNVSSITDNGTGYYTVNFSSALTDGNYAVTAAGQYSSAGVNYHSPIIGMTADNYASPSTTSFRVAASTGGEAPIDPRRVMISVHR